MEASELVSGLSRQSAQVAPAILASAVAQQCARGDARRMRTGRLRRGDRPGRHESRHVAQGKVRRRGDLRGRNDRDRRRRWRNRQSTHRRRPPNATAAGLFSPRPRPRRRPRNDRARNRAIAGRPLLQRL
jgi:hypothetical protein